MALTACGAAGRKRPCHPEAVGRVRTPVHIGGAHACRTPLWGRTALTGPGRDAAHGTGVSVTFRHYGPLTLLLGVPIADRGMVPERVVFGAGGRAPNRATGC